VADVVIDTDVASVLQKDRAPVWVHRHLTGARVWLTFITVAKLAKWAEVRSWGAPARRRLTPGSPTVPSSPTTLTSPAPGDVSPVGPGGGADRGRRTTLG
jgi:hypothetical protein